jgi:hypothetical protein
LDSLSSAGGSSSATAPASKKAVRDDLLKYVDARKVGKFASHTRRFLEGYGTPNKPTAVVWADVISRRDSVKLAQDGAKVALVGRPPNSAKGMRLVSHRKASDSNAVTSSPQK